MSADNWGICPKCKQIAKDKLEVSYGKVSQDEYFGLLEETRNKAVTLREDYEIWMDDDGTFSVSYSCSCAKCGFNFDFNYREDCLMKAKA